MAGSWTIAALVAVHFLRVKAQGHFDQRQVTTDNSAYGSVTTSLTPVATICADNRGFGPAPMQESDFQTTSATATLPGGGSIVFATKLRRQTDQPGSATDGGDAAQLVSGTDGCSTLFTPTTFSACSTVVSPIGLPPVTITECDQYVTFSSETLFMCPPTPTITPIPTSSFPFNRLAGSFTSRPNLSQNNTFMNASTTYTPGVDSNDVELASSTTRSYSGTTGMPMSLPRQLRAEKRQIMFDHTGKPMETEAAIIAPGKHLNPRQLMFHREGADATTDLVVVAPSTTVEEGVAPTNMALRNMMIASGMTGTGNLMPTNQTGIGAPAAVTTLRPIPDILKAKYKRKYFAIGHKQRQEEVSPTPVILNTTLDVENSTINATVAPASRNAKRNTLFEAANFANVSLALNSTKTKRALSSGSIRLVEAYNTSTAHVESRIRSGPLHLKDIRAAFHNSHTRNKRVANAPPLSLNATRTNSTSLSLKMGKLDTIRLANENAAAREAQVPGAQNLSPPSPTKFYAAPWSEVIAGGVPEHVLGITCYGGGDHIGKCTEPDSDGDPEECECVTERQSWSISTVTETRIGTTVVSYSGPLVITGAGGAVTTTSVRFLSTMETTRSFVDSLVVKKTLTGEETVTQTMTSMPSATISVLPVGDSKAAAPQGAPGSMTGYEEMAVTDAGVDEATTVQVTSYVATETVTVPPAEETGVAGSEMVADNENDGSVDATNVKRDCPENVWCADVWMAKLTTGGSRAEHNQE